MADNQEEWVRKRAYALWEEEGYPTGKHDEHWERARHEYAAFNSSSSKKTSPRQKAVKTQVATSDVKPASTKPAVKRTKKPTAGA
jgi:hypothetical protein